MGNVTNLHSFKNSREEKIVALEEFTPREPDLLTDLGTKVKGLWFDALALIDEGDLRGNQILPLVHIFEDVLDKVIVPFPLLAGLSVRQHVVSEALSTYAYITDPHLATNDSPLELEIGVSYHHLEDDYDYIPLAGRQHLLDLSELEVMAPKGNLLNASKILAIVNNINSLVTANCGAFTVGPDYNTVVAILPYNDVKLIQIVISSKYINYLQKD